MTKKFLIVSVMFAIVRAEAMNQLRVRNYEAHAEAQEQQMLLPAPVAMSMEDQRPRQTLQRKKALKRCCYGTGCCLCKTGFCMSGMCFGAYLGIKLGTGNFTRILP